MDIFLTDFSRLLRYGSLILCGRFRETEYHFPKLEPMLNLLLNFSLFARVYWHLLFHVLFSVKSIFYRRHG